MLTLDKLILAFKVEDFAHIEERIKNQTESIREETTLETIPEYYFGNTTLKEIDLKEIEMKTPFRYNYYVYVNNILIATLQWCCFGTSKNYGYMTLRNDSFYLGFWQRYKDALRDLNLTINNISRLDIAYDSVINPTRRYCDIVRNKENQIVINGVVIKDRDKLLQSPYFIVHGTANEPFKCRDICFRTKDKSTSSRCYNKTREIDEHSKKDYILESYKDKKADRDIYRCEVSLSSKVLKRIVEDNEGVERFLDRLNDENFLLDLHKESMMRMFRYSEGGKGKRKGLLSYYDRR